MVIYSEVFQYTTQSITQIQGQTEKKKQSIGLPTTNSLRSCQFYYASWLNLPVVRGFAMSMWDFGAAPVHRSRKQPT